MRKVTFGVANSLDNFIARADHGLDWLLWTDEVATMMKEFWQTIDTIVMGRKTYEVALNAGHSSDSGVKTYVCSRTMEKSPEESVTIVAGDAAEFLRELKAQEGKGIALMGGGELARSVFEADLIDEVVLNIHPVLLGSGIPLFHPMTRQIDLELVECKVLAKGCVCVTYRVKPRR